MWNNVGKNIKIMATIIFFIEAWSSIIGGCIILFTIPFKYSWWAIFIIILGPVIAWISSWLLYGLGEIIDRLIQIDNNTRPQQASNTKPIQNKNAKFQSQQTHNTTPKSKKVEIKKPTTEPAEDFDDEYYDSIDYEDSIPQKICPKCGLRHDFDYPRCPKCGHKYEY